LKEKRLYELITIIGKVSLQQVPTPLDDATSSSTAASNLGSASFALVELVP
jgi:hypothetical protein